MHKEKRRKMEWKDANLRFDELKDGDICFCRFEDKCDWSNIGFVIGVYSKDDGHFLDERYVDEFVLPRNNWLLRYDNTGKSCVSKYLFTGENVNNINPPL